MGRTAHWLLIILGLAAFARTARAANWLETTVVSDAVTVAVEKSGGATVSHSMALKVRGGPLKTWTLQGVDADAEPLPDASVVNMSANAPQNSRRELAMTRGDDASLQIDIVDDRGLKQGTYLLQFAYRTDLRTTKMVRPRGPWLEIGWIGPRFSSGLDGAKVTFRLPAASTAPRLPELDVDPDLPTLEGAPVDSFVSTARRNTTFDEIDLVRAHVALGEPVLWRLWASPAAFDVSLVSAPSVAVDHAMPAPIATSKTTGWTWIGIAAAAAILWIMALLAKLRLHTVDCRSQDVTPAAVVRLHPVLRVTLSGFLVAAAIVVAWIWQAPTCAMLCIAGAMLCAAQGAPQQTPPLRGPGVWLPLTDSEAFSRSRPMLKGRFMDATCWQGKIVLLLWFIVVGVAMLLESRNSSYDAALLGLMSPLPLPLFLTARGTQLPNSHRQRAAAWLSRLHRRLARSHGLKVIAWARFPDGDAVPDELRLRVIPPLTVPGFVALEVAYNDPIGDQNPAACLILRALEGSNAQQLWRGQLVWQRGRRADERVAIVPLHWPSWALAEDLIVRLMTDWLRHSDKASQKPSSRSRVTRSPGKSARISKAGIVALPSQATRRA
jgi:hypothetical protein